MSESRKAVAPKRARRQHGNKMYTSAPKKAHLQPTEKQKHMLGQLWDWQERSAKSHWVLGEPVGR